MKVVFNMWKDEEKGSALLLVFLIIILFTQLIVYLLYNTKINYSLSNNLSEHKKALYASRSGLELGRYFLEKNNGFPDYNTDGTNYDNGEQYGAVVSLNNGSMLSISFIRINNQKVRIISRGSYKKSWEELFFEVKLNGDK